MTHDTADLALMNEAAARRADLPRMFTAQDIASDTGLNVQTVYRLHRRGELPAVKIGRNVRFPEEAVRAWIQRGGTRPNGANP